MRALIIVDLQNDFCAGGALPVQNADLVARAINDYLAGSPGYDRVVATQDFHIDPGAHFSDCPDYSSSWPPHCRAGSTGAQFCPDLDVAPIEAVFRKGAYCAAYSGFEGVDHHGTTLEDWLQQRSIDAVDVVGVATDHCVRQTAEGAARAGFATRVLLDLTAGISAETKRDDLLAAVERSPRAAAAHDRAGWVSLFTSDGRVEDPVGSMPHVGHEQIGRFFDTFIGPRDIKFHRDLDIVCGTVVLRDVELEVAMAAGVTMFVPAFLRYDLRKASDEWKIAVLRAYWDLPAMMLQFLRGGAQVAKPALMLSRGLLGNQGLRGTAGFMTGFRRSGARHQALVSTFLDAVVRGDSQAATRTLSDTATITLGDDDVLELAELIEQLRRATWSKMIGSGSTVTVSVVTDHGRGIMFAELPWRGNEIHRVRYFPS